MKLLKKALLSCLFIATLSVNTTSYANENNDAPTCDEVLTACDEAVKALEKEVLTLKDLNALRADEVARLREREDTLERNKWIWLGAGLLVGVLGGVYVSN
jgi:hypothetical protein